MPPSARECMIIAAQLEERGRLSAAAAVYERLIGRDAANQDAFVRLAEVYGALDRPADQERFARSGMAWARRHGDTDTVSLLERVAATARG